MNKNKKDLCIIAVSYNSDNTAFNFLENLQCKNNINNIQIILVDNSERSDSTPFFKKVSLIDPDILCIKSPNNLGYFGGARLGLERYMSDRQDHPDWVIVCNVDLRFANSDFFDRLNEVSKNNKNIGVLAPTILSERTGRDKNPKILSRPSNFKMHLYRLIFKFFIIQNIYLFLHLVKAKFFKFFAWERILSKGNRTFVNNHNIDNFFDEIYAPHGSCMVFTKLFFLNGGSFDYPCFLFNEEVFVGEATKRLNLKVIHDARLQVIDDEHVSTGVFHSRKIAKYFAESAAFVANNYFTNS